MNQNEHQLRNRASKIDRLRSSPLLSPQEANAYALRCVREDPQLFTFLSAATHQAVFALMDDEIQQLRGLSSRTMTAPGAGDAVREMTLTATHLRVQLFRVLKRLADGEIDRVVITRPSGRNFQLSYDGPSELPDLAAPTPGG